MSEPAAIALKYSWSVQAIRCHTDGGIDTLGQTLLMHYKTKERVGHLIAGGNVHWVGQYMFPDPRKPHSFEYPQQDVTIADYRDKGKEYNRAKLYTTEEEYFNDDRFFSPEVMYLFKDGRWYYVDYEQIYENEGCPRISKDLKQRIRGW